MKWTALTYTDDQLVMKSRHLIKWRGRRIDLHRIMNNDKINFFHNHPANAFRIVLFGSYVEELFDGTKKKWKAGMMGFVPGPMFHRFDSVNGPCYTLWLRGKNRFKVAQIWAGVHDVNLKSSYQTKD